MYFYNNSALETGGAIYVSGQNVKPTPFEENCFYQLMDYTYSDDYYYNNTYQIKFEENHAKKSGAFVWCQLDGFLHCCIL